MAAYKFAWPLKLFQACNAELPGAPVTCEPGDQNTSQIKHLQSKDQKKARHEFIRVGLLIPTKSGRRDWIRTNDPHHVKVVL